MAGLFSIGTSGLAAAHTALVTTGHNIANADTPGFHRQQVVQTAGLAHAISTGFVGQGVLVSDIRRVYNNYLDQQVASSEAQSSYHATYSAEVAQIDSLLSDANSGLAPALDRFFSATHEVAANPSSMPARQAMLSSAETLATRFQTLDARLRDVGAGVDAQLQSSVSSVNAYAREIAGLNERIMAAQASAGHPPNDLLDKRGQLVSEVNKLVRTSTVQGADGSFSVTMGNGQPLVLGGQAFQLATVQSQEEPGRLELAYVAGSSSVALPERNLGGGSVGALLAFRSGALADARNQLGAIAAGLSQTFNAQHALGQDLGGSPGARFFSDPQASVSAHGANTGSAALGATLSDAGALTASDYRLIYTGGAYQLTRLSDNTTTTYPGLPQTVDGLTLALTGGAPANGDSFLIRPAVDAARDLRVAIGSATQIAAAAPMRSASSTANAGTGVISAGEVLTPLDANLRQPVTITFTGPNTFNVSGPGTGNPTGLAYTQGAPISYNGWRVEISGAPAAGDTFSVVSNTGATADGRNASRLADLQTRAVLAGGTTTVQAAYGRLTTTVGNTTREMQVASEAQNAIAQRARQSQQSISGVNLDEEAANLMRYQQAYQASGKVIEVAAAMFDSILAIGR